MCIRDRFELAVRSVPHIYRGEAGQTETEFHILLRHQAPGFEEELGREREALLFFPMFERLDDALVMELVHDVLCVVGTIRVDDRMNCLLYTSRCV